MNRDGKRFQKLVRALRHARIPQELSELLSTTPNSTLLAAAAEDEKCWKIIGNYARANYTAAPEPSSDCGLFNGLPAELRYRIMGNLGVRARVLFAATTRQHRFMDASFLIFQLKSLVTHYYLDFALVRFILIASGSLMSGYPIQSIILGPRISGDCLDFFTTAEWTEDLMEYLQRTGDYTADAFPILGTVYHTWTLRRSGRVIRVMECHQTPLAGVIGQTSSHRIMFFDGDYFRHAYAALMESQLTFTTPTALPIESDLAAQRYAWDLIHRARRHDLNWVLDHIHPHPCGESRSCPATFRHSRDNGWLKLNLLPAHYGGTTEQPATGWSYRGIGCAAGLLHGAQFEAILMPEEAECTDVLPDLFIVIADTRSVLHRFTGALDVSTVHHNFLNFTTLHGRAASYHVPMPSLHQFILKCFVKYLDSTGSALFNARLFANYNWLMGHDGNMVATGPRPTPGLVRYADEFIVFGVVRTLRTDGGIVLSCPSWHGEGHDGSVLTVRYHEQLLALASALKTQDLEGFFESDLIYLTSASTSSWRVGTVVFAKATLSIRRDLPIGKEEHYTLDVVSVEAVHPVA
ncbi:hypothetical protein B0H16DRAFT_1728696 [Mycena metata]|uniref:Uncharacterized protein n=1 Tax=Mycena metata TaxID=1033252 RepID=A0AAD7IE41_9AGAR|nr:hypothetical protein B0H16DRAFT_1728696 [Mycena metata]